MFEQISKLNDKNFRRKTGVKRNTFETMVSLIKNCRDLLHKKGGREMKLSYEDQTLMTLEYMREYRTYFSLGQIYRISESNCYKIIRRTEDILIKSKEFRLPNRKDVYEDPNIEAIVIDAAESAIERPKKNKENTTRERKRSILSRPKSS